MPHHYVSSRYFGGGPGNVSPSAYQQQQGVTGQSGQLPGQPPGPPCITSGHLIAPPPTSTIDTGGHSRLVFSGGGEHRTMPVRKQSVFVAPTGLSALWPAATRPSTSVSYVLSPPSPPSGGDSSSNTSSPPLSSQHPFQPSSYLSSASPPDPTWNSSSLAQHPLDLSEGSSLLSVIQNTSSLSAAGPSHLAAPSKEDISQHISRLILNNKALMDSFEPFLSNRNHQIPQSVPSYSKRSMSTTLQPSQSLVQSAITSSSGPSSRVSLGPYQFGAYQMQSPVSVAFDDPTSASIRRYSSQEVANLNSYSRLQSALLGESKLTDVQAQTPSVPVMSKHHLGRKYSEIPYQPRPHPESFKYPLNQSAAAYLQHQQKSTKHHKHSMILTAHEHLLDVLPSLNESSRSSSEPSLVRNLLTSKTSTFAHLVSSDMSINSNMSTALSSGNTASSTNSDSSIIKDLLLKSRTTSQVEPPPQSMFLQRRDTPPPYKRSRTESASYDPTGSQSNPSSVFMCTLCKVGFRNRQNLEVHQKFYCHGVDGVANQLGGSMDSISERLGAKRSHQEVGPQRKVSTIERKVSVLERPSIITYSNNSPSLPSLSMVSITSNSVDQHELPSQEQQEEGSAFGNILKSKLLSPDSYSSTPLKKRKISEPAFRYHGKCLF